MKAYSVKSIHISGLVQGVGFRPFVYRLALRNHICGWVENGNDGVRIHAEGLEEDMKQFLALLPDEAPEASQILDINVVAGELQDCRTFEIKMSSDYSDEVTEISPDIALCDECLADMKSQAHRLDYPFINCTNCGPRFSIIQGLPYDRAKTTMAPFKMCPVCRNEYTDVMDRRFHAQPIACNNCGPSYELIHAGVTITGIDKILTKAAWLIKSGKILAIKGIGGFHLACDATNETVVSLLRQRKNREGKPFAVMFSSLKETRNYLDVSPDEKGALVSWRRPIVILKNGDHDLKLAGSVSNGFNTTGVMLPYMPVHYLLFERLEIPAIVLTSGNLSDEPVIIDNNDAIEHLGPVADAFLIYNREIYNRTDDSVMMFTGGQGRLIRRSRGFAPSPVNLPVEVDGIFAAGAELVNCFCLGKDRKAIMSQHIGDLKNLETLDFYTESLGRFQRLFRIRPALVVCDLHPDYLSTRFAEAYATMNGDLPLIRVQHHYAHIAACMAEYGLDEKVIGISMDGVGYGSDGNIWGFEVMLCDLQDFERKNHLEYIPQPGGDKATFEPWRMALAYLYQYVDHDIELLDLPIIGQIGPENVYIVKTAIANNINAPLTSSAGRLFDGIAAMTGLCLNSAFHAEAPMRLENIIDRDEKGCYDFLAGDTIDPGPMIREIVRDINNTVSPGKISSKFHRSIVNIIIQEANKLRSESGINKVVLSGGTFQNRFIISETMKGLFDNNFLVFTPCDYPSNDGGIALGQLMIAAKRLSAGTLNSFIE
jgi:hydrogenase maturation protein HypF